MYQHNYIFVFINFSLTDTLLLFLSTGSSTSPDDHRPSAKEAMRSILKKSGSESETFESNITDFQENGFNLYSSVNSDPLLNLDVLTLSLPVDKSQDIRSDTPKPKQKTTLTRSVSESVVKSLKDSRASEVVDSIIHEDDVFPAKPSIDKSVKIKERQLEAARSIFSDSETVDNAASKKSKERKAKHSHKRSRSDISGIKTSAIEKEMSVVSENESVSENQG